MRLLFQETSCVVKPFGKRRVQVSWGRRELRRETKKHQERRTKQPRTIYTRSRISLEEPCKGKVYELMGSAPDQHLAEAAQRVGRGVDADLVRVERQRPCPGGSGANHAASGAVAGPERVDRDGAHEHLAQEHVKIKTQAKLASARAIGKWIRRIGLRGKD